MPNFWTKAEQFIGESLNGPRTKDKEFDKLTEKMKTVEIGLSNLKQILQKMPTILNQLELTFRELIISINQIYNNSPFKDITKEIQNKQELIEIEFSNFSKTISKIFSKTSEWTKIFNISKEQIKLREDKRKIYDHYEKKIEKIDSNNIKSKKEKEFFERNTEKYQKAAADYVDISEKAFNSINSSLNRTYDIVNIILRELINCEKNSFEKINEYCKYIKDVDKKFEECKIFANNPNNIDNFYSYDPTKYMDKEIMKRSSLSKNNNNLFNKVSHSSNSIINNDDENNVVLINFRIRSSFVDYNDDEFNKFKEIKDDFNN